MRNPNPSSPPALACIETPFLSVTAVVADAVLKAGEVRLLGFEPTGAETIVIRLAADTIADLETQGLTAILHATDAMLKAANVELVGKEKIGAAYVTIIIRGDAAAVKTALDVGSQAIGDLGKLIAAHVIARPHEGLLKLLP